MPYMTANYPVSSVASVPAPCRSGAYDPASQSFGGLVMHQSESNAFPVLAVEGEIDVDTVGLFHHVCTDAFQKVAANAPSKKGLRQKGIVVDLSRCCYVDSEGLVALVDAQREAKKAGIPLVFTALSSFVDHALHMTRLFRRLTIAATEEEAQQMITNGGT